MKLLLSLLAGAAGVAAALQATINAGLSTRVGLANAVLVNAFVVFVAALIFWGSIGARGGFFPAETSPVFYIGGICGFFIIATLAVAFPKIGAARAVTLMVLAQGMTALVVDHFGLFGMPQETMSLRRLVGVILVTIGVIVIKH